MSIPSVAVGTGSGSLLDVLTYLENSSSSSSSSSSPSAFEFFEPKTNYANNVEQHQKNLQEKRDEPQNAEWIRSMLLPILHRRQRKRKLSMSAIDQKLVLKVPPAEPTVASTGSDEDNKDGVASTIKSDNSGDAFTATTTAEPSQQDKDSIKLADRDMKGEKKDQSVVSNSEDSSKGLLEARADEKRTNKGKSNVASNKDEKEVDKQNEMDPTSAALLTLQEVKERLMLEVSAGNKSSSSSSIMAKVPFSVQKLRYQYLYGLERVSQLQDLCDAPDALMQDNFVSQSFLGLMAD